jgi:hypothetical protein
MNASTNCDIPKRATTALWPASRGVEIIEAYVDAGAPYGTERKAQETSIKWALLRLSAERVIPPRCTSGNIWRCGREDATCEATHCTRPHPTYSIILARVGGQRGA